MNGQIKQLYYITHIDNIPSILKYGILSHKSIESQQLDYTPIYDKEIVSNRKNKITPSGKSLWEYANLYFQARNPMLYRVIYEKGVDDIAVLAVSPIVLNNADSYITTGNAANNLTEILPSKEKTRVLRELKDVLQSEFWNDEDGSKRRIMAEFLVPSSIPQEHINAVYVASNEAALRVKGHQLPHHIEIIPEPKMFFMSSVVVRLTQNLSIMNGDLFFSRLHTLTVSVNTVGIMGKGLASRAKYQFPDVYVHYQDLCRKRVLKMGKPYLYKRETSFDNQLADEPNTLKNGNGETWFLLFPTKKHWKESSEYEGIENGMRWLSDNYEKEGIKSLAIPALGCGLGKLNWKDVGPMMVKYLKNFDIPVQLYLPAEKVIPQEFLSKDYLLQNSNNTNFFTI
jgi:hypothetical protein